MHGSCTVEVLQNSASLEHPLNQRHRPLFSDQFFACQPLVKVVNISDDGGQSDELWRNPFFPSGQQVGEQQFDGDTSCRIGDELRVIKYHESELVQQRWITNCQAEEHLISK